MRELVFRATVEKVGDVSIFLSFRKTIVWDLRHCEYIRQDVARQFRGKCDRQRICFIEDGEANKMGVGPVRFREFIEPWNGEHARDLAGAVCAEIKKDH